MFLRAFIAIEIPTDIKQQIIIQTAALRQKVGRTLRWASVENIHLTLKFLGDINPNDVDALAQTLKSITAVYSPFDISVDGLGAFPNLRSAHVLWVGLKAPSMLTKLQKTLDTATTNPEHPADKRAFSPHLTIGRVREALPDEEKRSLQTALENTQIGWLRSFTVQSIHLFQSDLKPAGPIYTCLSTADLGG